MDRILRLGSGPQMFFDNHVIEDMVGLRRRFGGFEKHPGNPVFVRQAPWEDPCGPVVCNPLRDADGSYRLWYEIPYDTDGPADAERIRRTPGAQGNAGKDVKRVRHEYVCYATSRDGIHWDRPALNLHTAFGAGNNVVLQGENGKTNGAALFHDPQAEDPGRRYIMLYEDKTVHLALSADGIRWNKRPDPVIPYTNDTGLTLLKRPEGGWRLYGRPSVYAGHWQRRVAVYDSDDLIHWSQPLTIMVPESNDEYYGMKPYRYGDFYVGLLMWFYSTTSSTLDCEWVFSRDGLAWQRSGCKALRLGEVGSFDAYRAVYGGYLAAEGERIRTFYVGVDARHNAPLEEKSFAIGMAEMRRDGFCWLDSCDADYLGQRVQTAWMEDRRVVNDEGCLLTRPFIFQGQALEINCNATHGRVDVAVLDMSTPPVRYADDATRFVEGCHEQPFAGLSTGDCDTVREDCTGHIVTWGGRADLSALCGKPVRLRFVMRGAKLYSFTLRNAP